MHKSPIKLHYKTPWIISAIVIYGFLITFGVSTSSLSVLSADAATSPGLVFNSPQQVRSDEFLRSTPLTLAEFTGGSGTSALDVSSSDYSDGVSESVFEEFISWSSPRLLLVSITKSTLNDGQAFSALWWFPVFTLLIFLPLYLIKIGVSGPISLITTLLILLSTSANWWSFWPIENLAPIVVGAYLAIVGIERLTARRRVSDLITGIACTYLSLVFLSQAVFQYVPWSWPLGLFFLALTAAYIVDNSKIMSKGKKYVFGYAFLLLTFLYVKLSISQAAISSSLATVYPGARRILDGGTSLNIFSGDLSWALQKEAPSISNQSELAISSIELFLVALSLLPGIFIFRRILGNNLPLLFGTVALLPFFLWMIAPWPSAFSEINPLRFFPPNRVAQIFGIPSIIVFGLLANFFRRSFLEDKAIELRAKKGVLYVALIPLFFIILNSNKNYASLFSSNVVPPKFIWGCAVAAIASIYFSLLIRNAWLAFAPMLILSLLNIVSVNPIVVGLGDLQNSSGAKIIQSLTYEDGNLWASDDIFVDALLMSNGAKLASGQQGTGPNIDRYRVLDPEDRSINSWNRGASYVSFIWLDDGITEVSSPGLDQIRIAVNPCAKEILYLGIKWVVSSRPLNNSCSISRGDFLWMGKTFYVYEKI